MIAHIQLNQPPQMADRLQVYVLTHKPQLPMIIVGQSDLHLYMRLRIQTDIHIKRLSAIALPVMISLG